MLLQIRVCATCNIVLHENIIDRHVLGLTHLHESIVLGFALVGRIGKLLIDLVDVSLDHVAHLSIHFAAWL